MKRHKRGFTLIEVILTLGILSIVAIGAAMTFELGVRFQTQELPARETFNLRRRFENRVEGLIRAAYLTSGGGATPLYYIGGSSSNQGLTANTSTPADQLTFTATAPRPVGGFIDTQDDFQTANSTFGPQGGISEVSISSVAVGDAGDRTGPFLRVQTPADGDSTQGGYEEVFDPNVTAMTFEFYDGTDWVNSWDAATMPEPRLPAAVRVTYTWKGDDTSRILIVRLPLSDVTPENPAAIGGTSP